MLTGTTLERFTVNGPLSCGGMGQVWLAEDENAREVVLKTVRPDLMDDEQVQLSFRREIDVTARLGHPHVVRHVAHGSCGGLGFLALEHIRGASLADMLLARPSIPVAAAVRVARDIADALAYVHAVRCDDGAPLGLVHGDVSPQNILIDRKGRATLIDFGAAITARDAIDESCIVGKPGYVSPEQSRGGAVDGRSDQFSLGVVLWEAVAGRSLFEGDAARRGRDIAPLSTFASVPFQLDAVVMRMLAYDADARFPSCAAAADALGAADDGARAWLAERAARVRPSRKTWEAHKTRREVPA